MSNRVYRMSCSAGQAPAKPEVLPAPPGEAPDRGRERALTASYRAEVEQLLEKTSAKLSGSKLNRLQRYYTEQENGGGTMTFSVPAQDEETAKRLEQEGAEFLYEEAAGPENQGNVLSIPETFGQATHRRQITPQALRKESHLRSSLARAMGREAPDVPRQALNHHLWMSADQDESNGTLLITWAPNPEGQPFGPGTGRPHPPLTVKQLIGYLGQLPQDMVVEAEGCDCVNEVKGVGLHWPSPDHKEGPRCILVCEPDFYGVLGPDERERHRRMNLDRRAREQTQREQAEETNKGPETSEKTFI